MFLDLSRVVICFAILLGGWAQATSTKGFSFKKGVQITDVDTLEYLLGKAIRISALPPMTLKQLPPIYSISKEDLNRIVCPTDPHNCRNLAAVFDDIEYRILVLDDFEITSNFIPYNYSFVIHEMIHALQYRHYGAEIFNGCAAVYDTELLAYSSQDKYLKEEGAFQRLGPQFRRGFYCDEAEAVKEYKKSKKVWDHRVATGWLNRIGIN